MSLHSPASRDDHKKSRSSRPDSPIASDHGYKSYATFFFVNAPYDRDAGGVTDGKASSTAQFCRQCHFSFSNEGNNSIPTQLE